MVQGPRVSRSDPHSLLQAAHRLWRLTALSFACLQPTVGGGGSDTQVSRKHMKGSQAATVAAAPAMAPAAAFCPGFLGVDMVNTLLGAPALMMLPIALSSLLLASLINSITK